MNPTGPVAKALLDAAGNGNIVVDLPLGRYRELNLSASGRVHVDPGKTRGFVPDYAS